MNTITLIVISVIGFVGVSVFVIFGAGTQWTFDLNRQDDNEDLMRHKIENPIKQVESESADLYIGKTISQWQNESLDSLMGYHKKFDDKFFEELGAFVLKNVMKNELKKQNIDVNYDFKLHTTMTLLSLPPHVGFESFVNSTDGNTYRIMGTTYQAKVESVSITKMVFFDTSIKLPLESILSQNNTIQILGTNDPHSDAKPYSLVLHGNKDTEVKFQNTLNETIRIQGDGDWQNPNWYGPTILPLSTGTMKLAKPGYYSWNARSYPESNNVGGGMINIIPDDFNRLSKQEKAVIGSGIIPNSEIPWTGVSDNHIKFGGDYIGIYVGLSSAINDVLPNATDYYTKRVKQLVPFDLPIIIEN